MKIVVASAIVLSGGFSSLLVGPGPVSVGTAPLPSINQATFTLPATVWCDGPCTLTNSLFLDGVTQDPNCRTFPWESDRRWTQWKCDRYQCVNGYNYHGSIYQYTWCTSDPINIRSCPNNSCEDPISP